jgi:hypothetical protein
MLKVFFKFILTYLLLLLMVKRVGFIITVDRKNFHKNTFPYAGGIARYSDGLQTTWPGFDS